MSCCASFFIRSNPSKVSVNQLLSQYTNNTEYETIKICMNIIKINKRNRRQERVFVLTNKAIYNIKAQSIKRRIALIQIAAITKSATSTEFSLSIPSEYDYRFDAKDKVSQNKIISAICQSIVYLNQEVLINTISASETSAWTVTKTNLKSMKHCNETVRTVMVLDHLNNMGFKNKTAFKALKQNNGCVSSTIHSLVGDYVDALEENKTAKSPFISECFAPMSEKMKLLSNSYTPSVTSITSNRLMPSPSFTELVDVGDVVSFAL